MMIAYGFTVLFAICVMVAFFQRVLQDFFDEFGKDIELKPSNRPLWKAICMMAVIVLCPILNVVCTVIMMSDYDDIYVNIRENLITKIIKEGEEDNASEVH